MYYRVLVFSVVLNHVKKVKYTMRKYWCQKKRKNCIYFMVHVSLSPLPFLSLLHPHQFISLHLASRTLTLKTVPTAVWNPSRIQVLDDRIRKNPRDVNSINPRNLFHWNIEYLARTLLPTSEKRRLPLLFDFDVDLTSLLPTSDPAVLGVNQCNHSTRG